MIPVLRSLVVLIGILAVADGDAATLQVAYGDGRLSVTADAAPLSEVLRAVARQAGFQIEGLDTLSEVVTISFASVPLREALRRLLATQNYVLIEDPTGWEPESPVSVRVLSRKGRGGATSPASAVAPQRRQGRPGAPPAVGGPAGAGETELSGEQEVRQPSEEELRRSAEEELRRSAEEELALRSKVAFPD